MSATVPLSFSEVVLDGALRATQLVPLLFALNAAQPAAAQLPRVMPAVEVTAPPLVPLKTGLESSPLTLRASHVDIRIVGDAARVRTTLTWRNDGAAPVDAHYRVPLPARLAMLQQSESADAADDSDGCADPIDMAFAAAQDNAASGSAQDDEIIEAGEASLAARGQGIVRLAPGEEVSVTIDRDSALLGRGDRHRLVLPLLTQRNAVFAPRFTAAVSIDAARPIVDLSSATHAADIRGIGDTQAQLVIADSYAHEGRFLAIDFTLGAPMLPDPAPTALRWGGESSARIASR